MLVNTATRDIRRLIWVYFWLLIFEGALRKWFLVPLSNPLLIVRDPIVLWMYYLAWRAGLFPKDRFTLSALVLALLSFPAGLVATVYTDFSNILVIFYGLRTNFLHLPLIFLIPKVFSVRDVHQIGRWFLILALPMAVLMALQFQASPTDFLNQGAGGGIGAQLTSAMGKIRPSGTFSFITGPVVFYAMVTAFLTCGVFEKRVYSTNLLYAAASGTVLALAVSGSRSAIGSVLIVFACLGVGALLNRRALAGSVRLLVFIAVAAFSVSFLPLFSEGVEVTTARIDAASNAGDSDLFRRYFGSLTEAFNGLVTIPLLGYGIGVGTNAGAGLLGAAGNFLLAENEWPRIIRESGPVLGGLFLLWRTILVFVLGRDALRQGAAGRILPVVLFGACAVNLFNGQFGVPTVLGFAALGGGLLLTALADRGSESVGLPTPVARTPIANQAPRWGS
jgi:hypothetical protein